MKMLKWSLAILLSGGFSSSFAYSSSNYTSPSSSCCHPCSVFTPIVSCGGFYLGVTGLYWRLTYPNLDVVQFESSNIDDFFLGGLQNQDCHSDHDWGYQISAGYNFACTANDIRLTYTHYDQDDKNLRFPGDRSSNITVNEFSTGSFSGTVSAILMHQDPDHTVDVNSPDGDGTVNVPETLFDIPGKDRDFTFSVATFDVSEESSFTLKSAEANLDHNAFDLDFGQRVRIGCNFDLRWFAGVRYAKLDSKTSWTLAGESHSEGAFSASGEGKLPTLHSNKREVEFTFDGQDPTTQPRIANLDLKVDEFSSEGTFDITSASDETFQAKSEFDGIGPRIGLSGLYHFCGGFGLIGEVSTALIAGKLDSHLRDNLKVDSAIVAISDSEGSTGGELQVNSQGPAPGKPTFNSDPNLQPVDIVFILSSGEEFDPSFLDIDTVTSINDTIKSDYCHRKLVPNIDAKVGLSYDFLINPCSRTRIGLEAGYKASYYFNSLDTLSIINSGSTRQKLRHSVDTSFDGPYVSVAVSF